MTVTADAHWAVVGQAYCVHVTCVSSLRRHRHPTGALWEPLQGTDSGAHTDLGFPALVSVWGTSQSSLEAEGMWPALWDPAASTVAGSLCEQEAEGRVLFPCGFCSGS